MPRADVVHRPDIRVVARLLGALREAGQPLRPTQLQLAAKTNYTQVERYLQTLSQRGLVALRSDENGGHWVELTPKGFDAHLFLVRGLQAILVEESPGLDGSP